MRSVVLLPFRVKQNSLQFESPGRLFPQACFFQSFSDTDDRMPGLEDRQDGRLYRSLILRLNYVASNSQRFLTRLTQLRNHTETWENF